ncbi:hypothetical protein QBC47DRAFT_370571 [Echria macrotheca]|uniref:C2H2-type domain-containing protein n=1 Tax=Echria macrotheca TaxID=438768 RepID=A0AAJ0BL10_9PEZI|nr:hypothetical protein QBC47DRAFT_370571 [Echria macrotheca]
MGDPPQRTRIADMVLPLSFDEATISCCRNQQSHIRVAERRCASQPVPLPSDAAPGNSDNTEGEGRGRRFPAQSPSQFAAKLDPTDYTALEAQDSDVSYSSDSEDDDDGDVEDPDRPAGAAASGVDACASAQLLQYYQRLATDDRQSEAAPVAHPTTPLEPSPGRKPGVMSQAADSIDADAAVGIETGRTGDAAPSLGCPFYLSDPSRHRTCLRFDLRSIHTAKKHVRLRHQRPPYCFICGCTFPTYAELNKHMDTRTCPRTKVPPTAEGVSQHQMEQLCRRSDRSLPESDQHRAIWKIIFPDTEPPATGLWLDHHQDGHVRAAQELRAYWVRNGAELVRKFLGSMRPAVQLEELSLSEFQEAVLDRMLELVWSGETRSDG